MEKVENKKIKNSTPTEYKGIKFKSRLEVMAYKTLEEHGYYPQYEAYTYTLLEGWKPSVVFYKRDKKTKSLKLDSNKIISIKYTPDIVFVHKGTYLVFLELKGFENDCYYLKKKLFRNYLENNKTIGNHSYIFAEIKTKKELLELLSILKEQYK